MLSAMDYLPVLFVALHCFMPVNGCERINFTIYPATVYVGDKLTFMCSTNDKVDVTVSDLGRNSVGCDVVGQRTVSGVFAERDASCFNNESTQMHAVANATTDMRGKNYTCTATVSAGKQHWNSSCNRKIHVLDVPELSLTTTDMTFNDDQNVTIGCFTNSTELDPSITLTLSIWSNTRQLKTNASVNRVETTFSVSRDFHEATVRCEALQVSRIKAKEAILRVNYIFPKRSIVKYHSANGSHTFNCAEHVESRPGVQYQWFSANSTKAIETQSSYTCKAPQWCNISVTCVATNNVTLAQSNITFIYQNHHVELNSNDVSFIDIETVKDKGHYNMIIAMSVACTVGTLVIVSIVVVVWKWRIYKRKLNHRGKMLCCKNDAEVISMKDNELYEAMPMMAAMSGGAEGNAQSERMDPSSLQATSSTHLNQHGVQSQHAIESLVLASATVAGNLKHKVGSKAYLVLLSDQSSTLRDIQEKIEETVSTRNSLKQVAFLLRQAKKGLVLSLADNVNIDGNSVASNQRLRDFLKQLVGRYMDKSCDKLRLDLLNCPDASTSKGKKLAKALTCLLGIPVYLSHDMYGVTTAIDNKRCVADVYFHRRRIENPVTYADVDLSKDSRRFPADSQEKVVYSEVIRPALRSPFSAGQ